MEILKDYKTTLRFKRPFKDACYERKAKGYFIVDGREVAATLQCCHCNAHFLSVRGSRIIRGFCMRCYSITCGKKECDVCIPFEKKISLIEKSKRINRKLIQ